MIQDTGGSSTTERDTQPKRISVRDGLELVKYYPNYARALAWYQDLDVCRQVDGIDHPYDLDRLKRMYRYLSSRGECYYIKYRDRGRWRLVGDIALYEGKLAIVVCREHQNCGIGRVAIGALVGRAIELGYRQVEAEIYAFNKQSRRAFEAAGFRQVGEELYVKALDGRS